MYVSLRSMYAGGFASLCNINHLSMFLGLNLTKSYQVTLYDNDRLWRTKHIGLYYQDGAFMWQDQFTKPNGRIDIRVNIPTFPTTWVVSAFAMSREHGLAILPVPARVCTMHFYGGNTMVLQILSHLL